MKVFLKVYSMIESGILFQIFEAATVKRFFFGIAESLDLGTISLYLSVVEPRCIFGGYDKYIQVPYVLEF